MKFFFFIENPVLLFIIIFNSLFNLLKAGVEDLWSKMKATLANISQSSEKPPIVGSSTDVGTADKKQCLAGDEATR